MDFSTLSSHLMGATEKILNRVFDDEVYIFSLKLLKRSMTIVNCFQSRNFKLKPYFSCDKIANDLPCHSR